MGQKDVCIECRGPRPPRKDNPAFPFCSERCKMIDLHRWLGGEYRIPVGADASERSLPGSEELLAARLAVAADDDLVH